MHPKDHLEEVDLQKYWLVLKRRWLPATGVFGTVVALSTLAAVMQKPTYTATASLLVKADRSSSLVGLTKVETGELQALTTANSPVETQAEIVRSAAIARATIEALDLRDDNGKRLQPQDISKQLKVKNIPSTDVLHLAYTDSDPERAAKVVNQVINVYIENNVAANRAEAAAAREFISREIPRVEAAVRQAERALREFKEANQIVALDTEATAAVNIIASIDQQIADTEAELAKMVARSSALRNQLGMDSRQAALLASLSQTPGVQEVLSQYQNVQSQLAIEQARYRSSHPTVANLQRQADQLRTLLQERVQQAIGMQIPISEGGLQLGTLRETLTANLIDAEVERISLLGQTQTLRNTLSAYRQRASTLPKLAQTQESWRADYRLPSPPMKRC
ncbi:MAG: GumC family protein [Leptolyngbya sp. IPPAS B-1204]